MSVLFFTVAFVVIVAMLAVIVSRLSELIGVIRERFPVADPEKKTSEVSDHPGMKVVVGGTPGKGGII